MEIFTNSHNDNRKQWTLISQRAEVLHTTGPLEPWMLGSQMLYVGMLGMKIEMLIFLKFFFFN